MTTTPGTYAPSFKGDIRSNYWLEITRGSEVLHERRIVLDPGIKRRRKVTATVQKTRPGQIIAILDPPLDLLRLEARFDGVQPGHQPQGDDSP